LHTINPGNRALISNLEGGEGGGALIQWGRGALRIYSIVTELETL